MKSNDLGLQTEPAAAPATDANAASVGLADLLTWIGEGKRLIAVVTVVAALASLVSALRAPFIFTARTTLLAPNSQQGGGSAALAALGSLGGLAGGLASRSPDELYVALLKGDSVQRALIDRFNLKEHYKVETYETLRKVLPSYVRVAADKKSGLITVEVDDESPKFAADLANAHADEITKVLGRLAVSEAQLRRAFFENQLKETKENLVRAEQALQATQEKSGMIVLDKQAEALIGGAAQLRAQITEREVQLKVLRTSATDQNPDVMRLGSELRALRTELARMESSQGAGSTTSAVEMPVGQIPSASIDYVRARRELKLQETLLEGMVRQYWIAKLDEAKEGPALQQVDVALPPDRKSKPSRALIVIVATVLALLASTAFVVLRRYKAFVREYDPTSATAWARLSEAWRLRRSAG
jgi:capsule polysaccharide export protein KpsE/RkpR